MQFVSDMCRFLYFIGVIINAVVWKTRYHFLSR